MRQKSARARRVSSSTEVVTRSTSPRRYVISSATARMTLRFIYWCLSLHFLSSPQAFFCPFLPSSHLALSATKKAFLLSVCGKSTLTERVYRAREEQYSIFRRPLISHGSFKQIPEHLLPAAAGKGHQEASVVTATSILFSMIHKITHLVKTPTTILSTIHLASTVKL